MNRYPLERHMMPSRHMKVFIVLKIREMKIKTMSYYLFKSEKGIYQNDEITSIDERILVKKRLHLLLLKK